MILKKENSKEAEVVNEEKIDSTPIDDKAARKKALSTALAQLEKDFGAGAVMKLGENTHMEVQAVHTGSLALDFALGIGGVPRGRIVEIYGPESSGKTTVALHCVAEAQKAGGTAAFIDVEHALDPVYANHLGVDIDKLILSQPDNGEQALDIVERFLIDKGINYFYLTGKTEAAKRKEYADEFNANDSVKVFLISLKAGGTGLNLIGADTVIHLDPWWNQAVEAQATDRTYRIGQVKNVEVIKLICEDSIEKRVIELQNIKKDLIDKLISNDDTNITKLSKEDLSFILK